MKRRPAIGGRSSSIRISRWRTTISACCSRIAASSPKRKPATAGPSRSSRTSPMRCGISVACCSISARSSPHWRWRSARFASKRTTAPSRCSCGASAVSPAAEPFANAGASRSNLLRALTEPWGRPSDLAGFVARVLKQDRPIGGGIKRANAAWPSRPSAPELLTPSDWQALAGDQLLIDLLGIDAGLRYRAGAVFHSRPLQLARSRDRSLQSSLARRCPIESRLRARTAMFRQRICVRAGGGRAWSSRAAADGVDRRHGGGRRGPAALARGARLLCAAELAAGGGSDLGKVVAEGSGRALGAAGAGTPGRPERPRVDAAAHADHR